MEILSLSTIDLHATSKYKFVLWLARCGLLDIDRCCSHCGAALHLVKASRATTDRYQMKCPRCKSVESIRRGTIFELFRTPLPDLTRLAVLFAEGITAGHAQSLLGLHRNTVSSFYSAMRERMEIDLDFDPIIFTSSDVVEIDETLIAALRNEDLEHPRTAGWVFGIVSRSTGEVHLQIVPDRAAATLSHVMKHHVEPGAIVCGDSWPAYDSLARRYIVRTINKGQGQMSYEDEELGIVVHTGTIEGVWNELRAILHASRGFPAHYVPLVLAEFIYRKAGRSVFALLIG